MDVRGAMQAGPDRDIERLIEDAAEIRRRQRLGLETNSSDGPRSFTVTVDGHAVNRFQSPAKSIPQFGLMAVNRFRPTVRHELQAGNQPRDAEDVWCAAFEKVGELLRL